MHLSIASPYKDYLRSQYFVGGHHLLLINYIRLKADVDLKMVGICSSLGYESTDIHYLFGLGPDS